MPATSVCQGMPSHSAGLQQRAPARVADGHALHRPLRAGGVTPACAFVSELGVAFKRGRANRACQIRPVLNLCDSSRAEASASRPDPDNPATTPAEPDPVPQSVSTQATSGETRDPFVNQLQDMADQMTERLRAQGRSLEFQVNGENNDDVVILIRASETGEVVRTIPPEEMANLSRQVRDGDLSLVSIRA